MSRSNRIALKCRTLSFSGLMDLVMMVAALGSLNRMAGGKSSFVGSSLDDNATWLLWSQDPPESIRTNQYLPILFYTLKPEQHPVKSIRRTPIVPSISVIGRVSPHVEFCSRRETRCHEKHTKRQLRSNPPATTNTRDRRRSRAEHSLLPSVSKYLELYME